MIVKISGQLIEKKEQSLMIDCSGMCYELIVSKSVLQRVEETKDEKGWVHLFVYYYMQLTQSSAHPMLIGFINELEKDFFMQFIKVSGIGPKAAVKALSKPISEITAAIDRGDAGYLKTLPGIGAQRAKEIVAKLQGKIGRFGLIKDECVMESVEPVKDSLKEEALSVLLQLQYKKQEAMDMIDTALKRAEEIVSSEELLNEIYKQKVSHT